MCSTCKGKNYNRRKSQVMMNVRRMTMLPVDEMRKLSQIIGVDDVPYPEAPEQKQEQNVKAEGVKVEEVSVEATVTVAPAEEAPAPAEEKQ